MSSNFQLLIMPSQLSNSSWSSGCPEEYNWVADRRRSDHAEEIIHNSLDDVLMDDPLLCPHASTMQGVSRRQRDRIAALEADMARQSHNTSNIKAVNEGIFERVSGLSAYNCMVVNDLAAARSLAGQNVAVALKYKAGFWIVTWLLIFDVTHILFVAGSY